jgi:limonene-1,2-epoxide hydrolase
VLYRRSLAAFFILVGLLVGAPAVGRAQDATPAGSLTLSPLLQQMVDGINALDGAAVAALYTEDGAHEDVPAGTMARGREELAAFVDETLGQFGAVRFEPVSGGQAGDLALLEYTFIVTDRETDQQITYRGVLVFELEGNLIRRSADYYDLAAILGQLGLLETGEAIPEATPAA